MPAFFRTPSWMDRTGIALSTLCLVHCVLTVALLAGLATAGGILGSELIHQVGLGLAILLGAAGLGHGFRQHGFAMPMIVGGSGLAVMGGALMMPHGMPEMMTTMIGVAMLALGHRLNVIARD